MLYGFLWMVVRALVRDLRRPRGSRRRARAARRHRLAERRAALPAPSSRSTRSPRSAATSTTRSCSRTSSSRQTHAALTYRGRAWYVEDLGSTNGTFVNGSQVDGAVAARLRRRDPDRPGPAAARAAARVSRGAGDERAPRAVGRRGPPARGSRPRFRGRELTLLVLVALALVVGERLARRDAPRGRRTGEQPRRHRGLADAGLLAIYLVGAVRWSTLALVLAGRRTDQILLPTVGLLGGIGLLLMERLPQDLASQPRRARPRTQLVWLVRSGSRSSPVWRSPFATTSGCAATSTRGRPSGVGLLLLTFVFGRDVNGARLTLTIGPFSGQPSELLKVILVVFLAGYLSENRPLLVEESTRVGPFRLPPLPYLAPMVAMWAIALGIVDRPARPRRRAPVLRRVPAAALCLDGAAQLRRARPRGVRRSAPASCTSLFDHVRTRIDIWLDPFADPTGRRLPGRPGAARVRPRRADRHRARRRTADDRRAGRRSRRCTRTSRSPRWARSWAWSASSRCSGCTSCSSSAGCGSRSAAQDEFRAILAAGLCRS